MLYAYNELEMITERKGAPRSWALLTASPMKSTFFQILMGWGRGGRVTLSSVRGQPQRALPSPEPHASHRPPTLSTSSCGPGALRPALPAETPPSWQHRYSPPPEDDGGQVGGHQERRSGRKERYCISGISISGRLARLTAGEAAEGADSGTDRSIYIGRAARPAHPALGTGHE